MSKAFTLMESGPVVLISTHDGTRSNVMTISWTMVVDFTPVFAMTTGDGTFLVDGRTPDRKKMMASKIPAGAA